MISNTSEMFYSSTNGSNPDWVVDRFSDVSSVIGALFFIFPILLLVSIQIAISYTYGNVVATIAAVEDTTPGASLRSTAIAIATDKAGSMDPPPPPYSDDPDAKSSEEAVPAAIGILVTDGRPLTSSLRATAKHLRRRAGRLARFRGLGVVLVWHFAAMVLKSVFTFSAIPAAGSIAYVVAQMICLPLNLLWNHIVISEPSSRAWFRRFAGRAAYRKMALPTLAWSLAQVAVGAVPSLVFVSSVSPNLKIAMRDQQWDSDQWPVVLMQLAKMALVWVAMVAGVWFPANVMFVRCQAALLAEDETPIVPLDRSFGGMVVAESEGGRGKLRMADAWRSLGRAGRKRVAGVYVKTAALHVVSFVVFMAGWMAVLFSLFYVLARAK